MNILDHFGDNQPKSTTRTLTPEVVTPSPAVPQRENALAVFRSDPAALKASALSVLDIKVKPVETMEAASSMADKMAQAKTLLKNIEARRKQIVEPLKHEAADVDAEARRWREPVEKWLSDAERVLLAFRRKQADDAARLEEARQQAIRDAAQKQHQASILGNTEAIEASSTEIMHLEAQAPTEAVRGFKTDSGTTSVRRTWKVQVVNAAEVPREFMVPDLRKLQAAVDAAPDPSQFSIPGCFVEEVETLVVRTRG
jgi:hypothetical protein